MGRTRRQNWTSCVISREVSSLTFNARTVSGQRPTKASIVNMQHLDGQVSSTMKHKGEYHSFPSVSQAICISTPFEKEENGRKARGENNSQCLHFWLCCMTHGPAKRWHSLPQSVKQQLHLVRLLRCNILVWSRCVGDNYCYAVAGSLCVAMKKLIVWLGDPTEILY